MIRLLDGPAAGVTLPLERAPLFLRVVRNQAGEWDGLDQLLDAPEADETVCVYSRETDEGMMHLYGVDNRGRRFGQWLARATYRVVDNQPADSVLRDNHAWRRWATAEGSEK